MSLQEAIAGLAQAMENTAKDRSTITAALAKTNFVEVLSAAYEHATSPNGISEHEDLIKPIVDDGLPPDIPEPVLYPVIEGIVVEWPAVPIDQRVRLAQIEYTPENGTPITVDGATVTGHTLLGLDPLKIYSIRVKLIDSFAQESGWSDPLEAQPLTSAISSINLSELDIAGELGWENLEPLSDPEKIGDAVITARTIASMNAAAVNLWAEDAAFVSAKIAGLTVDKLIGGTLEAGEITVASLLKLAGSGQIIAGPVETPGALMSETGFKLRPGPSYGVAGTARDQKISAIDGDWGSISFFDDTNLRGVVIRTDGDPLNRRGVTALHATKNGDITANGSARIEVESKASGDGVVNLFRQVWVQGAVEADNFKIKNSERTLNNHSHGTGDLPGGLLTKEEADGENGYVPKKNHSHAGLAGDKHGHTDDGYLKPGTNCRFRKADGLLEKM